MVLSDYIFLNIRRKPLIDMHNGIVMHKEAGEDVERTDFAFMSEELSQLFDSVPRNKKRQLGSIYQLRKDGLVAEIQGFSATKADEEIGAPIGYLLINLKEEDGNVIYETLERQPGETRPVVYFATVNG